MTRSPQDPERVPVPPSVYEGLEAVRLSGLTNMLDRPAVAQIADELGFADAAAWVREDRARFAQAIFHGITNTGPDVPARTSEDPNGDTSHDPANQEGP